MGIRSFSLPREQLLKLKKKKKIYLYPYAMERCFILNIQTMGSLWNYHLGLAKVVNKFHRGQTTLKKIKNTPVSYLTS